MSEIFLLLFAIRKALDQMNLQIHHVISDLAGTTGLAIVDAILAGERDVQKLAQLRDWRIRASEETIMKSLVGDYREEHLFTLRQSLESYRHYQRLIQEVDTQVKQMMRQLSGRVDITAKALPPEKNPRKTPWRNEPPQLREDLYRAFGVDLTQIPGINTLTAQMLLTEVGPDLSRFPRRHSALGSGYVRNRKSVVARYSPRRLVPAKTVPLWPCVWPRKDCIGVRPSWGIIFDA
jgi:transposase